MSSILNRPGWANYQILSEKIKIGDIETVIPGWGPGKEAKRHFAAKIGQEVPTGRYGAVRKVAGTSYREAELAFSRFLADSLEIAENVIATKEVKAILRDVTEEVLQQKGFDGVDDWIESWVEYAQEKFGLDLTNVAIRRAVRQIADEAEDQIEQNDAQGDVGGEEAFGAAAAAMEQEMSEEIKTEVSETPLQVQYADVSDDNTMYSKISFMGQQGEKIVYVRLENVPKDNENKSALRGVETGADIFDSASLSKYISQIEVEQGNESNYYKYSSTVDEPESEPETGDDLELGDEEEFKFDLDESTKLNLKQQSVIAEQVRVARKQHMQRIEERYRYY
jgi:hypothetical protein